MGTPKNSMRGSGNPDFWALAEGEFAYQSDTVGNRADIVLEFLRRNPDKSALVLDVAELPGISLGGLLDGLGVVSRSKSYALTPPERTVREYPSFLGYVTPVPFYPQNPRRATHDLRRVTLSRDIPNAMGWVAVWDGLLDCSTDEAWTLPVSTRVPNAVPIHPQSRGTYCRPYLRMDIGGSLCIKASKGYEKMFALVERIGEPVDAGDVMEQLRPLFGGASTDIANRVARSTD